MSDATHTAWQVESEDELKAWKQKLQDAGLDVSVETRHEVIESIYVRDPNGYFIEFTRKLRPLAGIDATDAALTLQAAMQAEADAESQGQRVRQVDDIWARKAALLEARLDAQDEAAGSGVRIFVPRVEEFSALIEDASRRSDCAVLPADEFDCIVADGPLEFRRKTLGLKPAVWYGLFTGGCAVPSTCSTATACGFRRSADSAAAGGDRHARHTLPHRGRDLSPRRPRPALFRQRRLGTPHGR